MTNNRRIRIGRLAVLCVFLILVARVCRKVSAQCIPVESELVRSTCGGCHQVDARHCMSRISDQRKTPEGWEDTIRRMGRTNGVPSSASQAREIIGYLAASQGLSSSEVQDIAYALEKRRNVVENVPNEDVKNVCTRCHSYARIAGERRTREEWLKLKDFHLATFPEPLNSPDWPASAEKALNYLAQQFPLHTPEWEREKDQPPLSQGRWVVWGHEPGRGDYVATMSITPGKDGAYQSLTSMEFAGGEREERSGEGMCYGGYAWRGSTRSNDGRKIREVFELSPDKKAARGRWFLEEQPEIGGEEERSLETGPSRIIGVLPRALKIPTAETSITVVGVHLPTDLAPADLRLGSNIKVLSILKNTSSQVVARVAVLPGTAVGLQDVDLRVSWYESCLACMTTSGISACCRNAARQEQAVSTFPNNPSNSRQLLTAMAGTALREQKTILRLALFKPSGKSKTITTSTSLMINSS